MIANGPGNCLTHEEHAHVALLGQASGIAKLAALGTWSVHSPCRMAEPPREPNRGSGGFPQKPATQKAFLIRGRLTEMPEGR